MKKLALATLFISTLLTISGFTAQVGYRYLGKINTPSPAFLKVEKFPGDKEFLLISEFGALTSGKVSVIPNIKDIVISRNFSSAKTATLYSNFKWPNSVSIIPEDIFGEGVNAIVVPDGFLPPGKTEGNVYVITTDLNDVTVMKQVYQISSQKSGYFYHTGFWVDVDGDGLKDYITARTNAQAGKGELVWYRHPQGGLQALPWEEKVITQGPDVMFDLQTIQGYEGFVVFASEFFNKRLTAYQISTGPQGGQILAQTVIDDTLDQAYSVKYLDINGDGKMELLVNNHESVNTKAAVFLYQVPEDIFKAKFSRTVIASGFINAFSFLIPNMCPGFPYAVSPLAGEPLHILIAGDGDYSAHLMRPDGTGGFKRELIKNLGGTVGAIATYDFDGDGALEFFVPNYDKNYIEVYQFYNGPSMADDDQFLQ